MKMSLREEEIFVLKSIFDNDLVSISDEVFQILLRFDALPKPIRLIDENSDQSTELSHLPPLVLHIEYPSNYPDENPPIYSIHCDYLSSTQLKSLVDQLDRIWTIGDVVVYQWIEVLREFFNEKLILSSSSSTNIVEDRRFTTEFHQIGSEGIYRQLIEYNRTQDQFHFETHWQTCPICCEDQIGRDCLLFELCRHHACRKCLNGYARTNFHRRFNCFQCDQPLFLSEIRQMFDDDRLFVQYQERLIELSNDVVWCPRCHRSNICPPSESQSGNNPSFVQCFQCQFAFCRRCNEMWHPQLQCPKDVQRDEILRQDPKSKPTFSAADLRKILMEIDTAEMVEQCTKPCPSCHVRIEKNGGCNHMNCRSCKMHFCWLCGWFGPSFGFHPCQSNRSEATAKATVSLSKEIHDKVEQMLENDDKPIRKLPKQLSQRVQRCPQENCGKIQVKTTRSNLLYCGSCEISFCFVCGERVYGDFHFSPYACQRVSDVSTSRS